MVAPFRVGIVEGSIGEMPRIVAVGYVNRWLCIAMPRLSHKSWDMSNRPRPPLGLPIDVEYHQINLAQLFFFEFLHT